MGFFVVLFYTGWSKLWPNQGNYAGGNNPSELRFPGVSYALAQFLADNYTNKLVGVGIDTLSSKGVSTRLFFAHITQQYTTE